MLEVVGSNCDDWDRVWSFYIHILTTPYLDLVPKPGKIVLSNKNTSVLKGVPNPKKRNMSEVLDLLTPAEIEKILRFDLKQDAQDNISTVIARVTNIVLTHNFVDDELTNSPVNMEDVIFTILVSNYLPTVAQSTVSLGEVVTIAEAMEQVVQDKINGYLNGIYFENDNIHDITQNIAQEVSMRLTAILAFAPNDNINDDELQFSKQVQNSGKHKIGHFLQSIGSNAFYRATPLNADTITIDEMFQKVLEKTTNTSNQMGLRYIVSYLESRYHAIQYLAKNKNLATFKQYSK
jgi:hypothetical protein